MQQQERGGASWKNRITTSNGRHGCRRGLLRWWATQWLSGRLRSGSDDFTSSLCGQRRGSGGRLWSLARPLPLKVAVPGSGVTRLVFVMVMVGPWWCVCVSKRKLRAGNGDSRGCRSLPEDVVVDLVYVSGFHVKTLVCFRLSSSDAWRRHPPGGVVVELRCLRLVSARC